MHAYMLFCNPKLPTSWIHIYLLKCWSKITVGGKLTHTHIYWKQQFKKKTLQRRKHYHPPAQHIFAASEILAGFQATKAAADPLSKDRQHPFNKDSHFQSHISMLKCCHPFSKGWRLQKSEFILQNWSPSRTFRVRFEDIQSEVRRQSS